MTLADRLKKRLDRQLVERVSAMLTEVGATDSVRETVRAYAELKQSEINELASALSDPEDEAELYRSIGYLWLELKSEWVRYNQTMAYQVARRGEPDPIVFTKGSVCSDVIGAIEDLLVPRDLEKLGAISVEPLVAGKVDVENVHRFLAHCEEQVGHIARIFASANGALFTAAEPMVPRGRRVPRALEQLSVQYQERLRELAQQAEHALRAPLELVWPALVDTFDSVSLEQGLRAEFTRGASSDAKIDLRLVGALVRFVRAGSVLLLAPRPASSAEDEPAGAPLHRTVELRVHSDENGVHLSLLADGDETFASATSRWDAFTADVAGIGSTPALTRSPEGTTELSITLPAVGLASGETFVVLSGTSPAVCVPAKLIADGPVSPDADAPRLDLRSEPGAPASELCVRLPSGQPITLIGSGGTSRTQGIAVPSTSLDGANADVFALSVLTGRSRVGVFDDRAWRALARATSVPAAP